MSGPAGLQPLSFPLHGTRLIEASAGTGKTWTIAALYVRLILGHGGEDAGFARPLLPPEILVVTFTEAATQELRDRIRKRLHEASRCFRGQGEPDDFLRELIGSYPHSQRPACARRLEVAAGWMDEAAVYTIHGWCNRMLRQHAFDSGSLFNLQIETADARLLEEAARDYWRLFFYPLDTPASRAAEHIARGPLELLASIKGLLKETEADWHKNGEPLAPTENPQTLLRNWADWDGRRLELETAARRLWAADRTAIESLLKQASDNGWLNGNSYRIETFQERLHAYAAWAETGNFTGKPEWFSGFAQSLFKMNKKHQDKRPVHSAFDALDRLVVHLREEPSCTVEVLAHAAHWIRARFAEEKQRRAQMDFDDLLVRLDQALQKPGGGRLAGVIRSQYPVALIDEFQDTDPLQYRIFATVYLADRTGQPSALTMIGDPKQAIYSFRGADIYSYLQARKETADRHYTLGVNFRSTDAMVSAVNRLFEQAERRPGGAFLFEGGADGNLLPFPRVTARGRTDHWLVEGRTPPALTVWHLPAGEDQPACGLDEYRRIMAQSTASEIVRLLNLGARGQAGFAGTQGLQALRPADIAVLVRDRREAAAIRRELVRRRLRSVYLSERDSVFDTAEAGDLLYWLQACAEPGNDGAVRAALGTATLALEYAELETLNRDELRWEAEVERFRSYRNIWRSQGVLPMLRRLMTDFGVPSRCLRLDHGERSLTNLLHLAEWLQTASVELDGELALIRHLAETRRQSGEAGRETLLRLESDADLIKVVTIHKSKGLEYPLVFLPFVCSFQDIDGRAPYYRYHDGQGRPQIELGGFAAAKDRASLERMQEDLRLLYVALTRARHACWLGVAPIRRGNAGTCQLHKSAMGQLLAGGEAIATDALGELLQELRGDCAAMAIESLPPASLVSYRSQDPARELQAARELAGRPMESWWIASYSALQIDESGAGFDPARLDAPDTPRQANLEDAEESGPVAAGPSGIWDIHRFPRGAKPGTFLHGLLEWAAREGFGRVAADADWRKDNIARRCHTRGWMSWINPLDGWLERMLSLPLALPGGAVPLRDLSPDACQPELEFWFAASRVATLELDRLVCRAVLPDHRRPPLQYGQLNGMLKGFIDLVFEHRGRYYIVDYKSNWLGADAAAYTREAMRATVLEKRYELQYALYLLALHRHLKARLPGYDYDFQIGGAAYLFLRGMDGPAGGLHFEKPPKFLVEALDHLFAGQRETPDDP